MAGAREQSDRPAIFSNKREEDPMAEDRSQRPTLRYQDVPDLGETFADTVGNWSFDGNTLRMEFLVSRLDPGKPADAPTGRSVPVCRLVLTAAGAVDLLKTCAQLTAALSKAGVGRPSAAKDDAAGNPA
jgi:hypothetical protein